jgi:hypothetical protein
VHCRNHDDTIVPTALDANYVTTDGSARLNSTFYRHVNEADASLDSVLKWGGAKYSHARRVWMLRHLVAIHCPPPNDDDCASVSAPRRGASVGAMRTDTLMSTFLRGIKKSISVFARRGGGRLTNARATIRR